MAGTSVPVASATTGTDDSAESDVRPSVPSTHVPPVHRCGRCIERCRHELEQFLRSVCRIGSLFAVFAIALLAVPACSDDDPINTAGPTANTKALDQIISGRPAPTDDLFEVFVCEVPLDTTDPNFGDLELRLALSPADIADAMNDNVTPYFGDMTFGQYRPHFIAGTTLSMTTTETHTECVERAVDESGTASAAVMVVADAENIATAPGGWGRPGSDCATDFCAAGETRRAFYVGASDFHPDWGPVPLLDLIEHEIGHTLGLPHSGDGSVGENPHSSALDVMSNSAAPRDLAAANTSGTNESTVRRNGQNTLAINRVALGWLALDDVVVADAGGRFDLAPSTGATGRRLLILAIDDESFLTVEYLVADGLNDFLPESGLAVHRIEQAPAACARPAGDTKPCTGVDRVQRTVGSVSPHLDLLDKVGDSTAQDGWVITITGIGKQVGVEVSRAER